MHDLFISHASEDKEAIARPLADAFRKRGWSVWYDEFELSIGDSLREGIDRGLANSRFGLVILSPYFFAKQWTRRELDGLTARETGDTDKKVILPIWHEVTKQDVADFSPPLADRMAIISSVGVSEIIDEIEYVLRTSAQAAIGNDERVLWVGDPWAGMKTTESESSIKGPIIVEPAIYSDHRGMFVETFRADTWAEAGISATFVQEDQSRSPRGTLRGMHFQAPPGQAKLVRCPLGRILDVVVDLRRGSPTFGKWESIILDDEAMRQLFVPAGFAHGFLALSEHAVVAYKRSTYFRPEVERRLRWNDPDVAIAWPQESVNIAKRDAEAPLLRDIVDELA
jgi:dTDP-4-dehydrorhamnose 3,5-epimerase